MYRTGEGVKIDYAEAFKWMRKVAEAGDGAAQSELGATYENGLGVPVDYQQAAQWYTKAVERGWGFSNLGSLYKYGHGVPQDDRKAVDLYRRGAEIGDANAQSNLGVMYATGRGVSRDYIEAYKWFTIPMEKAQEKVRRASTTIGNSFAVLRNSAALSAIRMFGSSTIVPLAW